MTVEPTLVGRGPFKRIHRRVLVVEDNADVLALMGEVLPVDWPAELWAVTDGEAALEYLRDCVEAGVKQLPDLVLLDLKLPRLSGWEVLERLRADARLHSLPVIVLSSSNSPEDIQRAYRHCANAYITKPINLDGYTETFTAIERFWLQTVTLPN